MAKTARIFATIDVNYFDDDRVIEAGEAWQLHFAAILACKRTLKDGVLTRRQLTRIAPESLPDVGASIARLIEVGLFTEGGDHIDINGWAGWNDSTEDIEAMSKDGSRGNHLRWHVKRKIYKGECEWCNPPDSGGDSGGDSDPNPRLDVDTDLDLDVDAKIGGSRVPLLAACDSSRPPDDVHKLGDSLRAVVR